jgi:hypothetical protein
MGGGKTFIGLRWSAHSAALSALVFRPFIRVIFGLAVIPAHLYEGTPKDNHRDAWERNLKVRAHVVELGKTWGMSPANRERMRTLVKRRWRKRQIMAA